MRRRDLTLYGQTNKTGSFMIANKQEMNDFFNLWKNCFFTIKIDVTKTQPLSVPLIVYYKNKIVSDMRAAFNNAGEKITLKETDERLRSMSHITIKEEYDIEQRKWNKEIIDLDELDNQQLVFFIEHLKDIAAQQFGVYIEDPNNLI